MNKREFVAGGVGAVVAGSASACPASRAETPVSLVRLLARTRRWPDLIERPGADAFEAYVGERFMFADGPGGTAMTLQAVRRVARCQATEQFTLSFVQPSAGAPMKSGMQTLVHSTGQRLALHLEPTRSGADAHFNLLV